jgi:hypothetical protein
MVHVRLLASSVALVVALVPMVAWADHGDEEVANAYAQLTLAQQESNMLRDQAMVSASSDRARALLESAEFRNTMLANNANGAALESISAALANAARAEGTFNATNELLIAQGRASVLLSKMNDDLANARAIGRTDEIRNAEAQATLMQGLADLIQGRLAETAMSSAKLTGEIEADRLHTPGLAQAANSRAMGANQLLAADTALNLGELNAFNTLTIGFADAGEGVAEAMAQVENALALDAAGDEEN